MSEVVIVERTKHHIVFDVRNMPPKWAITLTSVLMYDIPTMKIDLPSIHPQTNTLLDNQQWANKLGHVALESRHAKNFNYVSSCNCESGGPCCEGTLQLQVINESETDELAVYTDDIVSTDPRILPIHRTFSVTAAYQTETGIGVETDVPHTFDDGDLVTVLDSLFDIPRYVRATQCCSSPTRLVLVKLPVDLESKNDILKIDDMMTMAAIGSMVAHITKRQLLYYLAPKEAVVLNAIVRKGTGIQHIKWSPIAGKCYYRPLFRNMHLDSERTKNWSFTQRREFAAVCPKGVFDIEDDRVIIARPDNCDACQRCERWAVEKKMPEVVMLPKNRLPEWQRFTVKTNGSIDAADIVVEAFQIVQQRLTGRSKAASDQLMFPKLK
jgi:DNA-directed RNA polymerase alpha subunit